MKMLSLINNKDIINELKEFGEKNQISDDRDYKFNNQAFFDGKWDYL